MSQNKLINIFCVFLMFLAIMLIATPIFLFVIINQPAKCAKKYGRDYTYSLDLKACINFKGDKKEL